MTLPMLSPHFEHTASLLQDRGYSSPNNIAQVSFATFYQTCSDILNEQEAHAIYQEARHYALHAQGRETVAPTPTHWQQEQVYPPSVQYQRG